MIINGKKIKAKDLAKLAEASRSTVIKYYGISREDYLKEASKKKSFISVEIVRFEMERGGSKDEYYTAQCDWVL
ncbi:hypothetical protein [Klebsiella oxytoca]|uniref:hypothetical protein n=1 Tax=Klebsiella oxytoca TaxID=571 RepID=UPI0034A0C79B